MKDDRISDCIKRVSRKKQQIGLAKGRLSQLRKQIQEEFGVSSIKDAVALLKEKKRDAIRLSKQIEEKLTQFEEKYGDQLE